MLLEKKKLASTAMPRVSTRFPTGKGEATLQQVLPAVMYVQFVSPPVGGTPTTSALLRLRYNQTEILRGKKLKQRYSRILVGKLGKT